MSTWEEAEKKLSERETSGSLWLKLAKAGDRVIVVIRGEPYPFEICFEDEKGGGKSIPYDAAAKARGLKPKLRVALNVALYPSKECKVFEATQSMFKEIVMMRHKYGLDSWAFELRREGEKLTTEYGALPERQLTPAEQREYAALPLQDLPALYANKGGDDAPSSPAPAQGAPRNDERFRELINVLRVLPREQADKVLQRYSVRRVSDIPDAKLGDALRFAHLFANEDAASPNAEAAEDDFSYGHNAPDAVRPEQPTRPEGVRANMEPVRY